MCAEGDCMAFSEEYRAPRVRDIALALVIGLVILIAFLKLGDVVKVAGAVLYYVPARLSLVKQAGGGEVQRFNLTTMPELVSFPEAGRYALYTSDYDLLSITEALKQSEREPWITIKAADTGRPVPLEFVDRGMRVYDSHSAPGRPVLTFVIPEPGFYQLMHTRRPAQVAFARDYVTGNEVRIATVFALEIALVAAPFLIVFGRRYWRKQNAIRQMQRARRAEADAAMRSIAERRSASLAEDSDPHAPYKPKR
jgi:hypothetical protein